MDYEQKIRHPGSKISCGADILKEFSYTDIRNPYVTFSLINDSRYDYLKDYIDEKKPVPEQFNSNIIRLRD